MADRTGDRDPGMDDYKSVPSPGGPLTLSPLNPSLGDVSISAPLVPLYHTERHTPCAISKPETSQNFKDS